MASPRSRAQRSPMRGWSPCRAAIRPARNCRSIPLVKAGVIDADDIVIDAKSGVTGAGRAAKESSLFAEVSEGITAYGVAHHRHMPEIEQGLSRAAGRPVTISFTPHLMPMNRGILSSIYVRMTGGATIEDLRRVLEDTYRRRDVRARAAAGPLPGDASRARLQSLPHRARRRSALRPRDHRLGDRQSRQGRVGSGGAGHECHARPAGERPGCRQEPLFPEPAR